jgi:hypothetical protein
MTERFVQLLARCWQSLASLIEPDAYGRGRKYARDQIAAGRGTAVWHEVVIGALELGDFERGAMHALLEASVPDPRLSISTGDQS